MAGVNEKKIVELVGVWGENKRLVHVKEMYRGNVGMSMGNERVRDVTETLSGSRRRVGGARERQ